MNHIQTAFNKPGNWYKGNLHTHTNLFDGLAAPEEVAKLYRDAGYHFLAITDHNMFNPYPELSTEDFLMLPGVELTPGMDIEKLKSMLPDMNLSDLFKKLFESSDGMPPEMREKLGSLLSAEVRLDHVVAIAGDESTEAWTFDGSGEQSVKSMVEHARARGCLPIVAHPYWSSLKTEQLLELTGPVGVEVYNHVCAPREESTVYWDLMLNNGIKALPIACDDMHFPKWIFGGYLMVKAEELTHSAVVGAILNGDYYVSGGPEIFELEVSDEQMHLRCSEAKQIRFIPNVGTNVIKGFYTAPAGGTLTECRHKLSGSEKFVRVEIMDENGKKAWTNPVWFD
jgi:hypothetical protein